MIRANTAHAVVLGLCFACASRAQAQPDSHAMHGMGPDHEQVASVTFADLETTAAQLQTARRATEKYRDVGQAEADGYRAIGPDVPGMGIHYVRTAGSTAVGFDAEHPEILLYEKDPASPRGYALVGVSYLFNAEPDRDGQPKNPPFP